MWRRASSQLQSTCRSAVQLYRSQQIPINRPPIASSPFQRSVPVSLFSSDADTILSKGAKKPEDVMPIATGHEREEIEAALQGKDLAEMDHPEGPFGTKESPAIIKSIFDKRIVGCPGDEGEDEHDVVWFWLEKGKPHECPVCGQYFMLEVVGPGGNPYGHGDDDEHHH